ncbi:MAG TPA: hypothetical protein VFY32_07930 [Solirubrobacteraceae bacterium]|nr:hypothetical protein [Solirubrobacteraceae bacterium]
MRATRCCRWALVLALVLAAPASAAQVIAPRDVAARLAVGPDGRAFVVSPSARPDSHALSSIRRRAARPGAAFGPSRALMGSAAGRRPVDAGVAADGSGVIVVQAHRSVRAVAFGAGGALGRPAALSAPGARADFAASAVAPSGAAVVVWFRHRSEGRWRLEAATRAPGARSFGSPEPLSAFVRRPCCTSVSVAIGERGDAVATWSSTARPAVWAALRRPGQRFGRPRRLAIEASDAPRAFVGAGGAAVVLYSTQHVPLRTGDGLQLHRASPAGAFGPAEHVNGGGGVTVADAAVTPAGRVLVAWCDQVHGARVHVSEAAPRAPLAATAELGADARPKRLAVAADDSGRAAVAWSQRASSAAAYRERAVAALRPAGDAPFGAAVALGSPWRATQPALARLVPGGGALVTWNAARYGGPAQRRSALLVTRLP